MDPPGKGVGKGIDVKAARNPRVPDGMESATKLPSGKAGDSLHRQKADG
jgi:hypothetical protein